MDHLLCCNLLVYVISYNIVRKCSFIYSRKRQILMDNILPTLDIMYYHIYTLIHYMEYHVKLLFLKNDLCFEARTRTGSVLHISNLFKSTRDLFIRRLSNNFSMKENLILYEFRRYLELYKYWKHFYFLINQMLYSRMMR